MLYIQKTTFGLILACVLFVVAACSPEHEAQAANVPADSGAATASVDPAVRDVIIAKLSLARPDLDFSDVRATDVPELFEVEFNQGNVIYATASGDFFVVGEIYQVVDGGIVNLTEKKLSGQRATVLSGLDQTSFVAFPAEGETKSKLYVFTDVDCGYCRLLHKEVPKLNAMGIEVNYLAYPRSGLSSDVYQRMQSAWCSADRAEAMNVLKAGGKIPQLSCVDTSVRDQFMLGHELGVTGTPAIFLEDGSLIPGYKKADELAALIGLK